MRSGPAPRRRYLFGQATLVVVLGYAVFAALWILLSDSAVEALFKDPEQIIRVSMIKGWLFVAVTTLLLFVLVKRQVHLIHEAHQREIESYQERQRSHDLLTAIVDNSEDAIFAKDTEGRMLLFNRAACRYVGRAASEILGRNDRDIFPPAQAEQLMAVDRHVMADGKIRTVEEILDTVLGRKTLLATKGPLRDVTGHTIGIFGISRDITEIKNVEAALRQSESKLRSIIRVAPTGIGVVQNRVFAEVNDAMCGMTGYCKDELVGQSSRMLYASEEEFEYVGREKYRQITERGTGTVETHFKRKDGTIIDVLLSSTPINPSDLGHGVTFTALDITARNRSIEELRQRNEELERFNRITVGRELDMIELKQRINALEHELGREPPYPLAFEARDGNAPSA